MKTNFFCHGFLNPSELFLGTPLGLIYGKESTNLKLLMQYAREVFLPNSLAYNATLNGSAQYALQPDSLVRKVIYLMYIVPRKNNFKISFGLNFYHHKNIVILNFC